jgi:hypothetical protein
LRRAVTDLKANIQKRQRDEKRVKERAEKLEQKDVDKKRRVGDRVAGGGNKNISDLSFTDQLLIREFADDGELKGLKAEHVYKGPFIIRKSGGFKDLVNGTLKKTLDTFASQCKASGACKAEGKTHCMLGEKLGLLDAAPVFDAVIQASIVDEPDAMSKLAAVDKLDSLRHAEKQVWIVGWGPAFKEQRAATESYQVASLRAFTSGSLFVVAVPAQLAQEALRYRDKDPTATFTLEAIVGWLQNVEQETLDAIAEEKVGQVYYNTVSEGDVLYTPGGYITMHVPIAGSTATCLRKSVVIASAFDKDNYLALQASSKMEYTNTKHPYKLNQKQTKP